MGSEFRCICNQCLLHQNVIAKVNEIADRYLPYLKISTMKIEDRQFMFDIFELTKLCNKDIELQ